MKNKISEKGLALFSLGVFLLASAFPFACKRKSETTQPAPEQGVIQQGEPVQKETAPASPEAEQAPEAVTQPETQPQPVTQPQPETQPQSEAQP